MPARTSVGLGLVTPGPPYTGVNWVGCDLSNANLSGFDFTNANLSALRSPICRTPTSPTPT
ncbi:MAG: pentapeptide repeat-containing protein [Anaerolineae bacterium]|nr:pentapeptide repeat-containing protein [Anaerolineae bacterium]